MDDIMRQNPELMQQFTQAAVNQMGEANPGLGGFMGNAEFSDASSSRDVCSSYYANTRSRSTTSSS